MKVEKPEGPQGPDNGRRRPRAGAKPRRGSERGPIGFGSIMRDVTGGAKGAPGEAGAIPPATMPGIPGMDPAQAQALQLDPGAQAARQMGAVPTVASELADATHGVRDASEALVEQDRSPTQQANIQQHLPTPVARMTPAALLDTVLDEATRMELQAASKELHVELEPADLGPLIVRLRKGPDGSLDIRFRARHGDAARLLESGSELLRGRLGDAGFASIAIAVEHDADLRLGA